MKPKSGYMGVTGALQLLLFTFLLTGNSPVSATHTNNAMPFGFPAPRASEDGGAIPFAYRYPQAPLEVEGYPVAPESLKLQQVHVYVRHGE